MAILQYNINTPGVQGEYPRQVSIVSTDTYAQISAPNYLNSDLLNELSVNVGPLDVMNITYAGNKFAILYPNISLGSITLQPWISPGNVIFPMVAGNFAIFHNTAGVIYDAGISPTSAVATKVAMADLGSYTGNYIANFTAAGSVGEYRLIGTAASKNSSFTSGFIASVTAPINAGNMVAFLFSGGTIEDGGTPGNITTKNASDNTKADVASVSGTYVNNEFLVAADTAGTFIGSGSFLHAGTYAFAGGFSNFNILVAGVTTSSIAAITFQDITTKQAVLTVTCTSGAIAVTLTGDPGACNVHYMVSTAPV